MVESSSKRASGVAGRAGSRRRSSFAKSLSLGVTVALLSLGCASTAPYTWYTQLPQAQRVPGVAPEYVIGVGDSISVRVYEQEGLGGGGKIRSDGRLAFPLIGEVVVAGKHPSELAHEIELRLKQFIVMPRVTVNVDGSGLIKVTTFGEIKGAGATLELESPAALLQAIARTGGLSEFADEDRIFVVRQYPTFQRIRFTYDAILNDRNGAGTFGLRTGDLIVVE